jgi:hypothetical protein
MAYILNSFFGAATRVKYGEGYRVESTSRSTEKITARLRDTAAFAVFF